MYDWEDVRAQAAIAAMEALLENGKLGELFETAPYIVAKQSVRMANYLVEELKRNQSNEDLSKEIEQDIKEELRKITFRPNKKGDD
jgi:hypothetical protein